jgi:hypothetical protein
LHIEFFSKNCTLLDKEINQKINKKKHLIFKDCYRNLQAFETDTFAKGVAAKVLSKCKYNILKYVDYEKLVELANNVVECFNAIDPSIS